MEDSFCLVDCAGTCLINMAFFDPKDGQMDIFPAWSYGFKIGQAELYQTP